MPKIIVSDTSCLIILHKISKLDLLKSLFGEIAITKTIASEFGKEIPNFIKIENPKEKKYKKVLELLLDSGEASAIALSLEKDDSLLILDDAKARREAEQLNLNYTGTLGILIIAKKKGLINSITEIIEEIRKTDFRISEAFIKAAKKLCGE